MDEGAEIASAAAVFREPRGDISGLAEAQCFSRVSPCAPPETLPGRPGWSLRTSGKPKSVGR